MMNRSTTLPSICGALALTLAACGGGGGGGGPVAPAPGSLSGAVLDGGSPVSGATVTIAGTGMSTTTSAQGFFSFENIAPGDYTVTINGTVVYDPSDNSSQLPPKGSVQFGSVTIGSNANTMLNGRPVFLPTLDPGTQLDTGAGNTVTIPAGTVIENATGAALVFEQATTVTFPDDLANTTLSFTEIPISQVPVALPDGSFAASATTIQPSGMTFSPGVKLVLPNNSQLPAGSTGVDVQRFDTATGAWQSFGTATVDAEGETVIFDAGVRITAAGLYAPTSAPQCTESVTGRIVDADNPTMGVEGVVCTTINGRFTTTAADGTYTITNVPLAANGMTRVQVFVSPTTAGTFAPAASSEVLANGCGTVEMGTTSLRPRTADMTAPTVSSFAPANAAVDVATDTVLRIAFDEALSPGSVSGSTISIEAAGSPIAGALSVSGSEVTFAPAAPLAEKVDYDIIVRAGIRDAAGNRSTTEQRSTFSTAETATGLPVNVRLTGASTMVVGTSQQLDAGLFSGGGDKLLGARFTFTSSDVSLATVTATGSVTGRAAGTATITATNGSLSDTHEITLTAPVVATVVASPSAQTILAGALTRMTANVRDAAGAAVPGVPIAWSSENNAVATVDAAGVVTAITAGTATIRATSQMMSGTAVISVIDPANVTSIQVTPAVTNTDIGSTTQFVAIARDAGNQIVAGVPFAWSSSDVAIATVSAGLGQATAVAAGSATITATSGSAMGTASFAVGASTTLTVVVNGGALSTTPRDGIVVVRHDPTSGASLGEATTNAAGVATFGDIGAAMTSFTVISSRDFGYEIISMVNVPTGAYTMTLDPVLPNSGSFSAQLTQIPALADRASLVRGDYQEGVDDRTNNISSGMTTFSSVFPTRYQDNGRLSMFASVGSDQTGEFLGYGWDLERDPATLIGSQVTIDVSTAPVSVDFNAPSAVTFDGITLLRNGARFGVDSFGEPMAVSEGSIALPDLTTVDAAAVGFDASQSGATETSFQTLIYGDVASDIEIAMPDVSITNLEHDTSMNQATWTVTGANAADADFALVSLYYYAVGQVFGGSSLVEWTIVTDGASTSINMPQLPASQSATQFIGEPGISVELLDFDNIQGFAAGVTRLQSTQGNMAAMPFTANTIKGSYREHGAINTRTSGSGQGKVVSDPAGIDTSMGMSNATFPVGTMVTITATAEPGSDVNSFFCPGGAQPTGNPSEMTCTFEVGEVQSSVFVNFVVVPPLR